MTPEQERDRYIECLYGSRISRIGLFWTHWREGWPEWYQYSPIQAYRLMRSIWPRWHELFDARLGIKGHHDH